MSKVYTAQEMREAADFFIRNSESVRQKVRSNSVLANIHESTAMLRQAAEMHERAEELKAQCLKICGRETCDHKGDKCVCCARDVIDFIVRGTTRKKEDWK